jgi:hypothetical protein
LAIGYTPADYQIDAANLTPADRLRIRLWLAPFDAFVENAHVTSPGRSPQRSTRARHVRGARGRALVNREGGGLMSSFFI